MAIQTTTSWQIGKWCIEPALGRVSGESGEEFLRPREMDLLVYLAEQQGQIVTADDIVSHVWSGVEVTNGSLYFSISQLRKRLSGKCLKLSGYFPERRCRSINMHNYPRGGTSWTSERRQVR